MLHLKSSISLQVQRRVTRVNDARNLYAVVILALKCLLCNYHHLTTGVSAIKRLRLYVFALWGRDLVSVVRIRESPYYRGFFKRKYVRILLGHRKLSIIERCPY